MENLENEIWKDIIGYEGLYQVSNLGRVKNPFKILKSAIDRYGYEKVSLTKNKISKSFKVHRLVAINFIPNPENKDSVNHIDHNKLNNLPENLEWVNHRENMNHHFLNNNKNQASKYVGITWHKHEKKWYARVKSNGKYIFKKTFKSEEEAYEARIKFLNENNMITKYN